MPFMRWYNGFRSKRKQNRLELEQQIKKKSVSEEKKMD
jgi:hypothetical protein